MSKPVNWVSRAFSSLLGPAAVVAAGSMGAGSVATLILAGAWFRYDLLWVVLLVLPLFVAAVDTSSRIGAVNKGAGMLSIIRRHIHPSFAWLLILIAVPVHIFVAMGQFSVMTSAFLSLFGILPPEMAMSKPTGKYFQIEILVSVTLAAVIAWSVLSHGYGRMQRVMTAFLILMFLSFFLIALRSFQDVGGILAGLIPVIPEDLAIPGRDTVRPSRSTIIAIVGSALAPGALLAIPYMSSDARSGELDLERDLKKSIINIGIIFGAYSVFILVAGGFVLHRLPHHAEIETVHAAGQVLTAAFPGPLDLGPTVFSLGLFIAAMTTVVVALQVVIYISLDMFNKPWAFTAQNRLFRRLLVLVTLMTGMLAPLWDFPAMLKLVLLMGINVLVIPMMIVALVYLINRRDVMGEHVAGTWRNLLLSMCLLLSVVLAVERVPHFLRPLLG